MSHRRRAAKEWGERQAGTRKGALGGAWARATIRGRSVTLRQGPDGPEELEFVVGLGPLGAWSRPYAMLGVVTTAPRREPVGQALALRFEDAGGLIDWLLARTSAGGSLMVLRGSLRFVAMPDTSGLTDIDQTVEHLVALAARIEAYDGHTVVKER